MNELRSQVNQEIDENIVVTKAILQDLTDSIAQVANLLVVRLRAENKLILFGNGGSAAHAQHIAAEFVGRYRVERKALPAIALTADTSVLTALGNDYGFGELFDRQLQALTRAGDVALAISTSGNSTNVLLGVETARRMGAYTVGLTGKTGGELQKRVHLCLCVPSDSTPRIQEAHILIGHILSGIVEQAFLPDAKNSRCELATA
jgi:D-sedoheptulose 7-phosphate isomerase